jgi:hypothetical protein
VRGVPVNGGPAGVDFPEGGQNTLLAFLSSGCGSCAAFWGAFSVRKPHPLLADTRVVIVVQGEEFDSPSRTRKLAPKRIPVITSSDAWREYRVAGSPYFVYVDGASAEIRGEGSAGEWDQLERLISDALADAELAEPDASGREAVSRPLSDSHPDRIRQADRALLAAGIGPDHPSLWPGGKPNDSGNGADRA